MSDMNPPKMVAWNLGLRLGLEVTALVAIGALAWDATGGGLRWFAVVAAPLVAATLWGVFNVKDDPSRSGEAPVEVAGAVRLAVEAVVLGAGAIGLVVVVGLWLAAVFVLLTALHYGVGRERVIWLLAPS